MCVSLFYPNFRSDFDMGHPLTYAKMPKEMHSIITIKYGTI